VINSRQELPIAQDNRSFVFDQVLSRCFFDLKQQEAEVKFPFALPESARLLGAFLSSDAGKSYMNGLKAIKARLAAWTRAQGLDPVECSLVTTAAPLDQRSITRFALNTNAAYVLSGKQ
jgi:hypothetical protein